MTCQKDNKIQGLEGHVRPFGCKLKKAPTQTKKKQKKTTWVKTQEETLNWGWCRLKTE